MILKSSTAMRALFAAALVAGSMSALPLTAAAQDAKPGASAPSAEQGQPPKGWFKACTKQADNDVCIVQDLVAAPSGQLVTAVGLITVQGKVNRKLLQVSVPSARLIQPGVSMQIDDGKQQRIDYAVCMPDKCVAEVPLTDAMISSFKKGGSVTFTSVNFKRQPNPIKVSLSGFTDAFDGPAMKQSDLEARQKLLQEEMQKKAEAARKKLEAAQEKAKAGGK
jgi:invasion protein IalB